MYTLFVQAQLFQSKYVLQHRSSFVPLSQTYIIGELRPVKLIILCPFSSSNHWVKGKSNLEGISGHHFIQPSVERRLLVLD